MKNKRLRKLIRICMAALCSLSLMFVFDIPSFAETTTDYIYGTCVAGDGLLSGSDYWYYGTVYNYKYYSNTLASGRSNTYWILPKGYIYTAHGSLDDTGGYSFGIPSANMSLSSVTDGSVIDASQDDVYVIITLRNNVCSSVYFSYEKESGNPDNPDDPGTDDPDTPGGDVSGNDMSAVVEALNITNGKLEKLINHYVPSGEYVRGSEQLLNPVEYEFYDLLKIIAVSSVCINAFLLIIIFRRR